MGVGFNYGAKAPGKDGAQLTLSIVAAVAS